jgi:hypothetical protein
MVKWQYALLYYLTLSINVKGGTVEHYKCLYNYIKTSIKYVAKAMAAMLSLQTNQEKYKIIKIFVLRDQNVLVLQVYRLA